LVAWVVAGSNSYSGLLCWFLLSVSALLPRVGGPYAYARAAWGVPFFCRFYCRLVSLACRMDISSRFPQWRLLQYFDVFLAGSLIGISQVIVSGAVLLSFS